MHRAASGPANDPTFFWNRAVVTRLSGLIVKSGGDGWNRGLGREVGCAEPGVGGAAVMSVTGGELGVAQASVYFSEFLDVSDTSGKLSE